MGKFVLTKYTSTNYKESDINIDRAILIVDKAIKDETTNLKKLITLLNRFIKDSMFILKPQLLVNNSKNNRQLLKMDIKFMIQLQNLAQSIKSEFTKSEIAFENINILFKLYAYQSSQTMTLGKAAANTRRDIMEILNKLVAGLTNVSIIKNKHNNIINNDSFFKNIIGTLEKIFEYINQYLAGLNNPELISSWETIMNPNVINKLIRFNCKLLKQNPIDILLNNNIEYESKVLNCYEEVASRKSPIIFITNNKTLQKENTIYIPYNESFSSLLGIIPLQLIAYELSILRGNNPDKPKNLAKVVTVE